MTRRCAFDAHCANPPWVEASGTLCDECRTNATGEVQALRYDFLDLSQRIARETRLPQVRIRRPKPGPSEPIDLHVDALRSEIVDLVEWWGTVLRDRNRLSRAAEGGRDGARLMRHLPVLAARVDELAGVDLERSDLPAPYCRGVDGLLRLRWLHEVARRLLAASAARISLPGECPDRTCRARRLSRMDGGDTVTCGQCQGRWTYEDYQRYVTLKVTSIPTLRVTQAGAPTVDLAAEPTVDLHPDGGTA